MHIFCSALGISLHRSRLPYSITNHIVSFDQSQLRVFRPSKTSITTMPSHASKRDNNPPPKDLNKTVLPLRSSSNTTQSPSNRDNSSNLPAKGSSSKDGRTSTSGKTGDHDSRNFTGGGSSGIKAVRSGDTVASPTARSHGVNRTLSPPVETKRSPRFSGPENSGYGSARETPRTSSQSLVSSRISMSGNRDKSAWVENSRMKAWNTNSIMFLARQAQYQVHSKALEV